MAVLEIVTYGNPDALASVLRGVAYIFGDAVGSSKSSYMSAVVIALIVGFFAALMAYAFAPQKLIGWQWLFGVMLVYTLMFKPTIDVQVVDRLQGFGSSAGSPYAVVKPVLKVPLGLAILGYVTSQVGDQLTEAYELVFSGVQVSDAPVGSTFFEQLTYRNTGMMFGTRVVREISNSTFTDPHVHFNVNQYLQRCLEHDVGDGTVDIAKINNSSDIWGEILKTEANPAIMVHTSVGQMMNCVQLREKLQPIFADGGNQQVAMARRMAGRLGGRGGAAEASVLDTATQLAVNAGLAKDLTEGANIVRQAAFINAMGNRTTATGQRGGDPTANALGTGLAIAQVHTNSSWITSAQIAQEAMPLIRAGIEVILYAAFPIVVLMLMLTSGATTAKLLKSYAGALLWIQMWPPLYAVLNHLATIVSMRHVSAAAASAHTQATGNSFADGGGLTMLTAVSIYDRAVSDMAVVGYLVVSVPMIAWALIKGMDSIASGALAGAGAFGGGSSAGATAASTGSLKVGMISQDQVINAPSDRSGFIQREDGAMTQTTDTHGNVLQTVGKTSSGLGLTPSMVNNRASQLQASAAEKMGASNTESESVKTSITSALADTKAAVESSQLQGTETHGGVAGRTAGSGDAAGHVDAAGDGGKLAKAGSVSKAANDTAARQAEAAAQGGVAAKALASVGISFGGKGTVGSGQTRAITAQDMADKAEQWSKNDNKAEVLADMKTFVSSDGFQTALTQGVAGTSQLAHGYVKAATHEKTAQAAKSESLELSQAASSISSDSASLNQDLTGAFHQSLVQSHELEKQLWDKDHNGTAAHDRAEKFLNNYIQGQMHDPKGFSTTGEGSRPSVPNPAGLSKFTAEETQAVNDRREEYKPDPKPVDDSRKRGDEAVSTKLHELHVPPKASPTAGGSAILAEVKEGQGQVARDITAKGDAVAAATTATQGGVRTTLSAARDGTRTPMATNPVEAAAGHPANTQTDRDFTEKEIRGAGTPQPTSTPRTPEQTAEAAEAAARLDNLVNQKK